MDATGWDERYASAPLIWSATPNRFLVEEVADLPPGRALDVACGEGRNAIWLAEGGWDVTGVDFSAVAIDKARRWSVQRSVDVTWQQVDVVHEPLPGGPFDLVVVLYLQLVAAERTAVLRGAASRLATGGVLLVVAHDSTNIRDGWGGPQDPSVLYSPDDVRGDLAEVDLGDDSLVFERAERVERAVDTDEGPRVAIDVLVRARRAAR